MKLSNGIDVVARLARGDVNMPGYDGFPIHVQVPEAQFEAEVYDLLQSEPNILASRLLYYRIPIKHEGPSIGRPKDIAGRRLFLFQRSEGDNNVWRTLSPAQMVRSFNQLLSILKLTVSSSLPFLARQLISAHHFIIFKYQMRLLLLGFINAFSNRSPNRFLFPLLPPATSALRSSPPKSKPRLGIWAI